MFSRNFLTALVIAWLAGVTQLQAVEDINASSAAGNNSASDEAERAIKGFTLPKGFQCELVAAEPLLANPVAFSIDEQGRFYVAETFRLNAGVPDIRGRMNWLDTELASTSVPERIAYTKRLEPDNAAWWTNREDRISLLWDSNGDGKLDQSKIFAGGFNDLADGLGSGVLARRGDVYYTDIPHLWLLQDTNHDGVADSRRSLSYGYGVRYGFVGHDLHGLQIGPDGRLYYSIGDRGGHIVLPDGQVVDNSEAGAVYRCDLDGSNLEIVHIGLRNPQELVFDDFGNLWTADNNSDAGDPARIVYVAEGGDSGWRIGWQFLGQPLPRSSWLSERICFEDFPGRAAYALPPISSKVGNGPGGLTLDPGLGLPPRWRGHFFLCNFSGSPTPNSGILAFTVKPQGAGFALGEVEKFWWNFLPTDIDFGYDGCLYASDWINGWGGLGKGRIYRLFQPDERNQPVIAQVKKLFAEGFDQRSNAELVKLLAHPDRRVRQEAQFALVAHSARRELANVAAQDPSLFARLHAIWGLGQLERTGQRTDFKKLLADPQPEVRAQAAKVLGEAKDNRFNQQLVQLLADPDPRVRYFAALSLGKTGKAKDLPAVLTMLRQSDGDPWLRHAGVMALGHCATEAGLAALSTDAAVNVRLAAVVALRRQASAELAKFLTDTDPLVVAEATRAINDLPVTAALPALAALADQWEKFARLPAGPAKAPTPRDAILRRLINANYRVGTAIAAERLGILAAAEPLPAAIRLEAISALDGWSKPDGKDRISGLWRPLPERNALASTKLQSVLLEITAQPRPEKIEIALLALAQQLKWSRFGPFGFARLSDPKASPTVRIAALQLLSAIDSPQLEEAVQVAGDSPSAELRLAAIKLTAKSTRADRLVAGLEKYLSTGTVPEKQTVYELLAEVTDPAADRLLADQLGDLAAGKVPGAVQLDLLEAAAKRSDPQVKTRLAQFAAQRTNQTGVEFFSECLTGGNAAAGRKIFNEKVEASCIRCHKVTGEGGDAGPNLSQIGARADRTYLLESITYPNNQIAPGFENVQGTLNSGGTYAGMVKSETADTLELLTAEDGLITINKADIKTRTRGLSSMLDNMREVLTKRELRDLVEYLASLK